MLNAMIYAYMHIHTPSCIHKYSLHSHRYSFALLEKRDSSVAFQVRLQSMISFRSQLKANLLQSYFPQTVLLILEFMLLPPLN